MAASVHSHSTFGGPVYGRNVGSPPQTSSSLDSRHSYMGTGVGHPTARIEELVDGVHPPTATGWEDTGHSSRPISRAEEGFVGDLDSAGVVRTGPLKAVPIHSVRTVPIRDRSFLPTISSSQATTSLLLRTMVAPMSSSLSISNKPLILLKTWAKSSLSTTTTIDMLRKATHRRRFTRRTNNLLQRRTIPKDGRLTQFEKATEQPTQTKRTLRDPARRKIKLTSIISIVATLAALKRRCQCNGRLWSGKGHVDETNPVGTTAD